VEIRIGIKHISRELTVDVADEADAVTKTVTEALAQGDTPGATLNLTSSKGKHVIVPVSALAFVEFGGDDTRRVGFGTL